MRRWTNQKMRSMSYLVRISKHIDSLYIVSYRWCVHFIVLIQWVSFFYKSSVLVLNNKKVAIACGLLDLCLKSQSRALQNKHLVHKFLQLKYFFKKVKSNQSLDFSYLYCCELWSFTKIIVKLSWKSELYLNIDGLSIAGCAAHLITWHVFPGGLALKNN